MSCPELWDIHPVRELGVTTLISLQSFGFHGQAKKQARKSSGDARWSLLCRTWPALADVKSSADVNTTGGPREQTHERPSCG